MIRVLVADDHAVVREGLARILELVDDVEYVGCAEDTRTAIDRCVGDAPPDVLVLDLSLPGGGGSEVLRQVSAARPDLPIVVYSMYPEAQYGAPMMRAGAAAYLSKGRSTRELLAAIRRAYDGRRYVTDTVAERLVEQPNPTTPHERLSPRELQVLQLLAEGRGTGDIATALHVSLSTVSTHLRNIKTKLGLKASNEIIQYAFRAGLVS